MIFPLKTYKSSYTKISRAATLFFPGSQTSFSGELWGPRKKKFKSWGNHFLFICMRISAPILMSRSVVLKSLPPVFNVLLKQAVTSFNLKLALLKTDQKNGCHCDNEVHIWFLSLLSEPRPFECCANRPPASNRISGSCSHQEDERETPEKEAGQ